ncbi:MAG: isoprenylcysteine carboxylmethyltransferase family protein [Anaerolineales bacterium]
MLTYILVVTLVAQALLGGSLIVTLLVPGIRIWPPPGKKSWQYVFTWGLTFVSFGGILALGILDWNSFLFDHWLRFPVGIALIAFGLYLVLWAIRTLGSDASQGLGGGLIREGPYRWTRNPQYVADLAILAGFAVLSNSFLALITGALAAVWFILAPFTEEPWLRDQLGEEYEQYMNQVPRFISIAKRAKS